MCRQQGGEEQGKHIFQLLVTVDKYPQAYEKKKKINTPQKTKKNTNTNTKAQRKK